MIKRKRHVYLCYDYRNNGKLKDIALEYLNSDTSMLKVTDCSRAEKLGQNEWEEDMVKRFGEVDAVIIILGEKTYLAPNVIEETEIAYGMNMPMIQFSISRHGVYRGLPNGGYIVKWDWEILQKKILLMVPY